MSPKKSVDPVCEIVRDCVLTRTRRISRVITGIYDDEMRAHGINASQFSLLVLIAKMGGASRAEIGRTNFQDRTTLTRNLAPLLEAGWVEEVPTQGGRSRPVVISQTGQDLLAIATPAWRSAQIKTKKLIGQQGVDALIGIADGVPSEGPAT